MDWNAMAAPWLRFEAETDAAHQPILDAVLARAALKRGARVLDIGPGAGVTLMRAADAIGPDGHVTGIEIAPPFVARARARTPENVTVIEADAGTFDYPQAPYDAAISLLGVMFFADPVAAFARIRSALLPGAAFTFGCWGVPQHNPWFTLPERVASEVFGPGVAFHPGAPGPMSLGAPEKLSAILRASGWRAEIDTQDLFLTPKGKSSDVARMQTKIGAAAMRMRVEKDAGRLTLSQRDAIYDGLLRAYAPLEVDGVIRVPARVHIVHALA